ncbi:MAG: GldG family protein [Planctomycetes bacterium]|nr:GldG family protein [Planctomycetota bacterium]
MRAGALRRFLGRSNLVVAAILAVAVWMLAVELGSRPRFKALIDVTPQARFTVGPDTLALFDELATRGSDVRIDTFFVAPVGGTTPYEVHALAIIGRVQELTIDMLARYRELAGERIAVVHYDINRDVARVRERIAALGGLREAGGVPENVLVVSVGSRRRVLRVPFDLATVDDPARTQRPTPGAKQQVPRLVSFEGEAAISGAIRSLLSEGTPKVYVATGYGETSLTAPIGDSYSELMNALQDEGFQIARLELERERTIPDDAAVLALLEPRGRLSEAVTDAIVAFLRRGGRVVLNTAWTQVEGERWNPTFPELAQRLGFAIGTDLVCHLIPDPANPNVTSGGPGAQKLTIEQLSAHPITEPLRRMQRVARIQNARAIAVVDPPPADVRVEPLLRTGPLGWLAPRASEQRSPYGVDLDPPPNREAYAPRTVAAIVEVDPASGERPGQLVLITGLMLQNGLGFPVNADFGLNVFNWLTRRDERVTVRGNRYVSTQVEVTPPVYDRAKSLLVQWIPLALLCIALLVMSLRHGLRFGLGLVAIAAVAVLRRFL